MSDPFHLQRFVDAQQSVYATVLAELRLGEKRTHWMWFIFPQIAGLGQSATARHFAIGSVEEARAFLAQPVLGERLRNCTDVVNALENRSAQQIFGAVDALKFRSSMTLFDRASADNAPFATALERFYAGEPDTRTLDILARAHRRARSRHF